MLPGPSARRKEEHRGSREMSPGKRNRRSRPGASPPPGGSSIGEMVDRISDEGGHVSVEQGLIEEGVDMDAAARFLPMGIGSVSSRSSCSMRRHPVGIRSAESPRRGHRATVRMPLSTAPVRTAVPITGGLGCGSPGVAMRDSGKAGGSGIDRIGEGRAGWRP